VLKNKILDVSKVELAGIPCLYIKPNFIDGELPTLVFYHGWSSRKENSRFLAEIIAYNGYAVILPDNIDHGERGSLDYDAEGVIQENFWRIILNSVDEFKLIIKDAVVKLAVNPYRLAVGGHSMGGFISSGIFAANPKIKTLICINGGSAWEKAEEIYYEKDGKRLSSGFELDKIRQYDPIMFKDSLYPRPMLLLHGDSDTSVYIDIQKYFYNEMLKVYCDCPEKIKLFEVQRLNHDKTVGMMEEAVRWLDMYL
jgi:dienelactone hydrolase